MVFTTEGFFRVAIEIYIYIFLYIYIYIDIYLCEYMLFKEKTINIYFNI